MVYDIIDEEDPWFEIGRWIARKAARGGFDAAAYYCPYIPLTSSGVIIDPATFQPVISLMTRYGNVNVSGSLNSLVVVHVPTAKT
jgi:hypothetical protein